MKKVSFFLKLYHFLYCIIGKMVLTYKSKSIVFFKEWKYECIFRAYKTPYNNYVKTQ